MRVKSEKSSVTVISNFRKKMWLGLFMCIYIYITKPYLRYAHKSELAQRKHVRPITQRSVDRYVFSRKKTHKELKTSSQKLPFAIYPFFLHFRVVYARARRLASFRGVFWFICISVYLTITSSCFLCSSISLSLSLFVYPSTCLRRA